MLLRPLRSAPAPVALVAVLLAACSGDDDGGDCSASACGLCLTGCTAVERCVDGEWECRCDCMDAGGGTDAGPDDAGADDTGSSDAHRGDASGGEDAASPDDAGGADSASICDTAQSRAATFIEANKDCVTDADCVQVSAPCYEMQEDCCVVYLKAAHDATEWSVVYAAVSSCASGGGCGCCAAIPAPAGCLSGRCGPRR